MTRSRDQSNLAMAGPSYINRPRQKFELSAARAEGALWSLCLGRKKLMKISSCARPIRYDIYYGVRG